MQELRLAPATLTTTNPVCTEACRRKADRTILWINGPHWTAGRRGNGIGGRAAQPRREVDEFPPAVSLLGLEVYVSPRELRALDRRRLRATIHTIKAIALPQEEPIGLAGTGHRRTTVASPARADVPTTRHPARPPTRSTSASARSIAPASRAHAGARRKAWFGAAQPVSTPPKCARRLALRMRRDSLACSCRERHANLPANSGPLSTVTEAGNPRISLTRCIKRDT